MFATMDCREESTDRGSTDRASIFDPSISDLSMVDSRSPPFRTLRAERKSAAGSTSVEGTLVALEIRPRLAYRTREVSEWRAW
jgi:hypothetical protein